MPVLPFKRRDGVLDVHMVDPIGERSDELDRINALPVQVAGIEVEAEFLAMIQGFKRTFGRVEVERDFRRMYFQGKLDATFAETHPESG